VPHLSNKTKFTVATAQSYSIKLNKCSNISNRQVRIAALVTKVNIIYTNASICINWMFT